MDTADTPNYFQARLNEAANAADVVLDFKLLLLDRFAALARAGKVHDRHGRPPEPITNIHKPDHGGYGHWDLKPGWERTLDAVNLNTSTLTFVYTTDGDHAGTDTTTTYKVPWAQLMYPPQDDADHQEYLRLKAIYEPDETPAGMAPACPSCGDATTDRAPSYCDTPEAHRLRGYRLADHRRAK